MRFFVLFLFILIESCAEQVAQIENADSSKDEDSITQPVLINKDTFEIIDEIVASIQLKIKNKELIRKGKRNVMDPEGGNVHGYFYPDNSISYLYSSFEGELGKDETESFFQNNKLLYSVYRHYYFLPYGIDFNNLTTTLKGEKIFYFPGTPLSKDSVTIYNEDVKFERHAYNLIFQRDDFPSSEKTAARINTIKTNLEKRENK